MQYQLVFVFLLGIASTFAAPEAKTTKLNSVEELKKLSPVQKLMLSFATLLKPDLFPQPLPRDTLSTDYETYYSDVIFNDLRLLFLHGKKLKDEASLPEMGYYEHFDFCFWVFCFDFHVTLTTENTRMTGFDTMTSNTVITPNSVKNVWHVGRFNLTSPQFLYNITSGSWESWWADAEMYVSDLTATLDILYEVVPELGLQVRKLNVEFTVDNFVFIMKNFTEIDKSTGEVITYDPFEYDFGKWIISDWLWYYQADFEKDIKSRINCVLSNGRVDPIECNKPEDNYYDPIMYYKMNIVQLVGALGFGARSYP